MSSFMIVGVDNLARETVADRVLFSSVPDTPENRSSAEGFCDWLNSFTCYENGGTYYRVEESGYRPSRGVADLV